LPRHRPDAPDDRGGEFGVAVTGMHVPDRWGDADRWVTLDFAAHSPVQSAATGILDPCFDARRNPMAELKPAADENEISRDRLAELLNEDLSREYQAIIAYVVYSQVLSGAQYMDIAAQLEIHAKQELDHALILSRQIDYLGKMPVVTPKPVRTSKNPKDMLRYDLDNENETIRNYRDRIRQCETLGEYAMAEQIRQILMQEQDHQIDLATALGEEVPDVSSGPKGRALRKRR
jgi:bacterioferritin